MRTTFRLLDLTRDEGLAELYMAFRTEFTRWATHNHRCTVDDALEIFQASVVVLYENVRSGKIQELQSSVKTYLFAIGKNKLHELIRSRSKTSSLSTEADFAEVGSEKTDPELIQLAVNSLDDLGEPCRSLLKEVYYHRSSMTDIVDKLGYKNEDAAKSQKYKCLVRLRKIFQEKQTRMNVNG